MKAWCQRAFAVLARGLLKCLPVLRSRTGYANPRVQHITALGYPLRAYAAIAPNVLAWLRHEQPLFPTSVLVQTHNRCNGACPICPYHETVAREPYELMADDLWERIARECAGEPSFLLLVPTSKNEPLLDPRLEQRMAFFRGIAQPHQAIELVTNGALLTGQRLTDLVASGLDLITVSVSAADAQTYRAVTGGLDFHRLEANLDSLKGVDLSRVNLFVRFVRQRANYRQERAFRRRWRKAGFNIFAFEINNRSGAVREYGALQVPSSPLRRFRQFVRRHLSQVVFPACPYAFAIANVLQNGDVILCANDWHNREVLGNVGRESLRSIYNSPRMQEIRRLMVAGRYHEIGPCRDCSMWQEANWF